MRIVRFDSCNTFTNAPAIMYIDAANKSIPESPALTDLAPIDTFAIDFDAYDYQIKQIYCGNGADKYILFAVNHSDGAPFILYSSINEDSVRYLLYCIILDYVNGEKICNLAVHINDATNPNCVAVGMTDEYAQKLVARSHASNY